MGNLRLHDEAETTDAIPFPTTGGPRPRLVGRDEPDIAPPPRRPHHAEDAIERVARQLDNLRALLGDDLGGPTGPRAA
ncbi:MAG: hypothetical protein SFY69_08895 [Planctomycetota bacterium]|nr:hypothetical protein [Planctomycetota bacterium]